MTRRHDLRDQAKASRSRVDGNGYHMPATTSIGLIRRPRWAGPAAWGGAGDAEAFMPVPARSPPVALRSRALGAALETRPGPRGGDAEGGGRPNQGRGPVSPWREAWLLSLAVLQRLGVDARPSGWEHL